MATEPNDEHMDETNADRRKFLASASRFAAVVPPAMVLLLSTSMSSKAIAQSGGIPRGDHGPTY